MEYSPNYTPQSPKKKNGPLKILLIILGVVVGICLILFLIGLVFAVNDEPSSPAHVVTQSVPVEPAADGKWTLMFYLCGTDLESDNGMASLNLSECAQVRLPENVRLLICTGGTAQWQTEGISNEDICYLMLESNGDLTLLEQLPSSSMGDAATLGAFLNYGVKRFPAERYGAILWNHGGGMGGIAFDELYGGDSLSIAEIAEGFSQSGAKFELAGFDACLMAALENAMALSPYANYMVASEESEPGTGWDYTALLSHLAENPDTDGAELGKLICDSFMAKCGGYDESCTLSVTDLSKVSALGKAFDAMAAEMTGVTGDVDKYRMLTQEIARAENYGGNTDNEGYFNLVDIGDMVLNAKDVLSDTGEAVLDALFDAVVYNISGSARSNANGLSTFYPIKTDAETLDGYASTAAFSKNYLIYLESSRRDWSMPPSFTGLDFSNAEAVPPAVTVADESMDVRASSYLDDNGAFNLEIEGGAEYVADVCFTLHQMDYDYNEYMFMGRDDDLNVSEDGTLYSDNFRGVWPALEGIFVNLNLLERTDEYNLYSIPVNVNGREMSLRAVYDWDTQSYSVLGVIENSEGNTFASRSVHELEKGDVVEILMVGSNWDSLEDTSYSVGNFTVDKPPVLEELPLTDGDYLYQYEMTDLLGDTYYSASVIMECKNGEITVYETEE